MTLHAALPGPDVHPGANPGAHPAKSFTLPASVLAACAGRAGALDRDGRFFDDDLADLRAAGFLAMAVPEPFGGSGLGLGAALTELARLAAHAPATALGLNMHLLATGVAAGHHARGDRGLDFVLESAVRGRLFAAGVSEPGNDFPGFQSLCRAERVDDGYRFTGEKMFTSMAPAWDDLHVCGLDEAAPDGPVIIHGYLAREAGGAESVGRWDTLSMRATHSFRTRLDRAFVPMDRIVRRVPPGVPDPFIVATFTWGLLGFATIYLAIARRALAIATETVKAARTLTLPDGRARHPEVQHLLADMAGDLWASEAFLLRTIAAWEAGDGREEDWLARLLSTKRHAVETAWSVTDSAVEVTGNGALFRGHELERLFRDARCGRIHPANAAMTREIVAKTILGIPLDDQPRWG